MKIGYARVSKDEQNLDLQIDALKAAGCDPIFSDSGVSGGVAPSKREGFAEAFAHLEAGATLAVWKMDRLGRSLSGIIETIDGFKARGVQFVSLTENIDTTNATGRAFWQFIGLMAELERGLIQERTKEGLQAARRRGKRLGRPPALSAEQVTHARSLIESGRETMGGMASALKVDRGTLRRALSNGAGGVQR